MTREEKQALKAEKAAERKRILDDWKAEKQHAKALRKARLKARPFWVKLLCFIRNLVVFAAVCAGVFFLAGGPDLLLNSFQNWYKDRLYAAGYEDADLSEVRALIPADEDAGARIAAMPGYSKEDSWTICVYMIGSNLESDGENDLSSMVSLTTSGELAQNEASTQQEALDRARRFADEIAANGMEMPGPLYYQDPPQAGSVTVVTQTVVKSEKTGAASMDLNEIRKVKLPENISVVIETGGAGHWSDSRVNPNRVQRFCCSSAGFMEEESAPAHDMCTADSVADFLRYCDEKHPADHRIVIFWDHGAGAFGYGNDELFGSSLTLAEMKKAFSSVCTADPENPHYEVIGFDACLMANQDAVSVFDGYGRYFAGSEELEPGFGWYYTEWLQKLADDPGMNGAQVGLAIADSYMDFYARENINLAILPGSSSLNFGVLDIHKVTAIGAAYEAFCRGILTETAGKPRVLSDLSSAARSSVHYGSMYNKVFNMVDLGAFMDAMPAAYDSLTAPVKAALAEAVLYTRSDEVLEGSQGLSVYFPDHVLSSSGISYLMNYVENIASKTTGTLYFYKAAGCLTDDMRTGLTQEGIEVPANIDTAALAAVSSDPITLEQDSGFSVAVSAEAQTLMQDPKLAVGCVDEENEQIIYYGEDSLASLDGEGKLSVNFDNRWLTLDGELLCAEVMRTSGEAVVYSSPILLDGTKSTLIFRYDRDDDAYSILGAYDNEANGAIADYAGRIISDLEPGVMITPIYYTTSFGSTVRGQKEGKAIRYDRKTKVKRSALPDGNYLEMATFTSTRGDEFTTGTVELTLRKGRTEKADVSTEYISLTGKN